MNKKRLLLYLPILLVFLLSSCSPSANSADSTSKAPSNGASKQAALVALNRDQLKNYAATFKVDFKGTGNWVYQLKTQKTPKLREENLHLEGVDKAQNPGDVRLVTDGTTSWMLGAGTDNECVQFPNNQGMDPTYITPEALLSFDELKTFMKFAGEEQVAGKTALHFSGSSPAVGAWKNARVDLWQEKSSGALLRYQIQAAGTDAYFGKGSGEINASYQVDSLSTPKIAAVKGCEIGVALPNKAAKIVRLPGMASFEVPASKAEISSFYQTALPKDRWVESEPASESEGSTVLSYVRGAEGLEVHIEGAGEGASKVKLIFEKSK